jgi:hypothetical protein
MYRPSGDAGLTQFMRKTSPSQLCRIRSSSATLRFLASGPHQSLLPARIVFGVQTVAAVCSEAIAALAASTDGETAARNLLSAG